MFSKKKEKKSCGRKLFCFLGTVLVLAIAVGTAWYFLYFAKDVESLVGDCGGCHCIPDESTGFSCPSQDVLASYPEKTHIDAWKSQTILNPYTLTCNPYSDGFMCDTEPPIDPEYQWTKLGETAVCAIHYESEYQARGLGQQQQQQQTRRQEEEREAGGFDIYLDDDLGDNNTALNEEMNLDNDLGDNNTALDEETKIEPLEVDTCETKDTTYYRIKTYPSREAAESAGGFVTHVGNCGVCSTLQDLAVYANMENIGKTSPGNFCQRQAATSFENGLSCYRNLGMTQDCAKIWADTSWNTARNCFGSCVLKATFPQFSGDNDSKNNIGNSNATQTFAMAASAEDSTEIDSTEEDSGNKWYDLPATLRDIFTRTEEEAKEKEPKSEEDKKIKAIPGNGPAPECAPNDCITCNDEQSAEIFERFAGRSRRRSGLLSTVARRCSTLPDIVQHPCPDTLPLAE